VTSVGVRIRNGPAVARYPPGATLGPRVLPCFEFVWMLSGRATWHCANAGGAGEVTHTLRPGMLLLTRPGLDEHFAWDADESCVHAYVSFYIDESGRLPPSGDWPLIRQLSAADPLAALCRYLLWLAGTDSPEAGARGLAVLSWLVDVFVAGPISADEDPALDEHLVRMVDHLRTTWGDGPTRPPRLDQLAAAATISPGHLARLCRQRFGVGPVAAVELIRLARAAILLERSNLSVGAIADACGFVNPFHFSRRFRTAYGVAPRAYRTERPQDPLDPVRRSGLLAVAQRLLVEDL
jgi:AraC family transcriptional regulator